jgi:hypothetical protein
MKVITVAVEVSVPDNIGDKAEARASFAASLVTAVLNKQTTAMKGLGVQVLNVTGGKERNL